MKILILGGFGFLGGRISRKLGEKGHDIILGSRILQVPPVSLSKAQVRLVNWKSIEALKELIKDIEIIIHASGMNANECQKNPQKALEVNGTYTKNLIKAIECSYVKKLFYLSTIHVYSSPLFGDINEQTKLNNNHPYAISNRYGEDSVLSVNQRKCKVIVLRLSNGFGAPIQTKANCWSLLVNELCKKVIKSSKLNLTSDGSDIRDFITISDICSIINKLIQINLKSITILNVGSGQTLKVLEMTKLIQSRCSKILKVKPKIYIKKPSITKNIPNYRFNINKLKGLGIYPKNNFKMEIDNLLKFCHRYFNK